MTQDMTREEFLEASLGHALFDGWSEATIALAATDLGMDIAAARALFPRGPVDLALEYHRSGDRALEAMLATEDLSEMKVRERITHAVKTRLLLSDRDLVRNGFALFALPQNAATGSKALWGTSDLIWRTLGDPSRDINWYTKRATLSAVISSTVLYWLGDDSEGQAKTWDFLDRRIENVMQFERFKSKVKSSPFGRAFDAGPGRLAGLVSAPKSAQEDAK
ncbi:MAG: COQ9 family protein [Rhodobacterales bacterium]|nr:MAG: COQ9 family protein [Rhodobacterales bacterium]